MSAWLPAYLITGIYAVAAIAAVCRERRKHDREVIAERFRLYKGPHL